MTEPHPDASNADIDVALMSSAEFAGANGSYPFEIRPATFDDAVAVSQIHNSPEAEGGPRDPNSFRRELERQGGSGRGERLVAVCGSLVVAYAAVDHAWWTGCNATFALQLRVARAHWNQGIGTALYTELRSEPYGREATRLLAWIRDDVPEARRFAVRHGFTPTGQVIEECRLYLPEARSEHAPDAARLRSDGIRLQVLAEIRPDESFLRALQELWSDGGSAEDTPFDVWRSRVLEGDGLSPATHWVALDHGRPVGTTFLNMLGPRDAENDYTAVAPSHRGRGIAYALKVQAIAWGRERGMDWFYTSSLLENGAMRTINRCLGYRPGAHKCEVACEIGPFVYQSGAKHPVCQPPWGTIGLDGPGA